MAAWSCVVVLLKAGETINQSLQIHVINHTSSKISYNQDSFDTKGHTALVTQPPAL